MDHSGWAAATRPGGVPRRPLPWQALTLMFLATPTSAAAASPAAATPAAATPAAPAPSTVPRPPAKPAVADLAVPPGEAVVWYLGHCGYAVRTAGHLLIFDYIELEETPGERGLDRGFVDPAEIEGVPVRVFATHEHVDHFDPLVMDWQRTIPDIQYYFGWHGPAGERCHDLRGPRAVLGQPGLEVFTVNSRHAGVDEVAFLVKVDGLTIFHGGDYQGRPDRGAPANAVADMRYLREQAGPPDLFFLGAWTGDPYLDILRGLSPRTVFPGHWRRQEAKYAEFAAELARLGFPQKVLLPQRRGDRFVLRNGGVEAMR